MLCDILSNVSTPIFLTLPKAQAALATAEALRDMVTSRI